MRFADVAAWANVPVGTVIVIFNGADNCYGFTVNESGTGPYFINVNSTSLIQRTGSGATPNGSGGNCGYCGNSYTATGATAWASVMGLGNTADAIQVRCPDCPASEAGFFHGVGYGGSTFDEVNAGTNDLGGAHFSGNGTGRTYELTGTGCGTLGDATGWTRTNAPASGTPPATAGVVGAGVLAWLEGCEVPCCGSFEPPVVVQKHGYRFGFQGQEKDDEMHGATGTSYAFEYRMHDARVGRFLSIDPLAFKYPFYSPYAFSGNRVIDMIELEGLEPEITSDKLRAMGDQNSAWGFGARGNENTGWQQDINGQTYQTYQCTDCYTSQGNKEGTGLAGNELMWGKAPALAQNPLPTIPNDANSGPVGGNAMDQPALQVTKADAGQPAPPPVSRPKPAAPERHKFLPVGIPIYITGDMLERDGPMGPDAFDPLDKMINAINANAGQYSVLSLSVQLGQGLNYNTERGFSENGFNQLSGYIRSRLNSNIQIQRGSVGPANDRERAIPNSSVAIYLH